MARYVAQFATDARDVRETIPLRGIGGFLEVSWAGGSSDPEVKEGRKLEVEQWEITPKHSNLVLPLSGGKGSLTRRRVSCDFSFAANTLFDLSTIIGKAPANKFALQPFLDGRLEGQFGLGELFAVAVRFQCGDPTFFSEPDLESMARPHDDGELGVYYFCPRALLDEVHVTDSSQGKPPNGCVRAIVRGSGMAPLERYVGTKQIGRGGMGSTATGGF